MPAPPYDTLRLERVDRVLVVRVVNPPQNDLSHEVVEDLDRLTRALEGDRSVGAVVITGGLEGFWLTHYDVAQLYEGASAVGRTIPLWAAHAGLALAGLLARVPVVGAALERTPYGGLRRLRRVREVYLRMMRMPQVFIAAMNGPTFGGALELALACDLRLIAEGQRIGLIESAFGILTGGGGAQRLVHLVGEGAALEMALGGELLTAEAAHARGVVHRVVRADELLEASVELGQRLARRSVDVRRVVKRSVYRAMSRSPRRAFRLDQTGYASTAGGPGPLLALRTYAAQLDALDRDVPFDADRVVAPWVAGTVVDFDR